MAPEGIGRPGGRFAAIALAVALVSSLLVRRSSLPGIGAALFGLAMILGLAGWAFHASGDRRMRFRRDLFFGIAAGVPLGLGLAFLWS